MQQTIELILKYFSLSAIRYFVLAGIPFLLCYKLLNTWLSQCKIQDRSAQKSDFIRDILHSMQTTAVLVFIAFMVVFTPLRSYTRVYLDVHEYAAWWFVASIVLSLIIHDTYFYWMHRLLHHPKIFRRTHLLHHKSTNPSPWTSYSFHFIEAWTEGFALIIIVVILPITPLAILSFTVVAFMINVYGHLGYEIAPKWFRKTFLFEIFNSSVHHNLHHSKFKGNYGLYFRIWDRLMGTENPNYVQEYDRIQAKRIAGKTTLEKEIAPISDSTSSSAI